MPNTGVQDTTTANPHCMRQLLHCMGSLHNGTELNILSCPSPLPTSCSFPTTLPSIFMSHMLREITKYVLITRSDVGNGLKFLFQRQYQKQKNISKRRYNSQVYSQQSLHRNVTKSILFATVILGKALRTASLYSARGTLGSF